MMMMMMMMMMMVVVVVVMIVIIAFIKRLNKESGLRLIYSQEHCQRFSPSCTSNLPCRTFVLTILNGVVQ